MDWFENKLVGTELIQTDPKLYSVWANPNFGTVHMSGDGSDFPQIMYNSLASIPIVS